MAIVNESILKIDTSMYVKFFVFSLNHEQINSKSLEETEENSSSDEWISTWEISSDSIDKSNAVSIALPGFGRHAPYQEKESTNPVYKFNVKLISDGVLHSNLGNKIVPFKIVRAQIYSKKRKFCALVSWAVIR